MDDQKPKPRPQLPTYRIRLKPPMADEEQAEYDRQYDEQVAAVLKGCSKEELQKLFEPEIRRFQHGRTVLMRLLARRLAEEIKAEELAKNLQ
jgi:hypothetical protein